MSKTFKSIKKGLNQAIAHANGELDLDDIQTNFKLSEKEYNEVSKALDKSLPKDKQDKLRKLLNEQSPWDDVSG